MRERTDLEGEINLLHGVIRRLSKDLLQISKLAMPDTYYATDSRVKYAKACSTQYKKKPKP